MSQSISEYSASGFSHSQATSSVTHSPVCVLAYVYEVSFIGSAGELEYMLQNLVELAKEINLRPHF